MRTRLAVGGLGAALVFLVTGCGASAHPTASGSPSANSTNNSATPDPSAVAVGSVMSVNVPQGWVVTRGVRYSEAPFALCLQPIGATRGAFGCPGVRIYYGGHLPGAEVSTYAANQPDGWYTATDVQPCPVGKPSTDSLLNGVLTQPGVAQGLKPVGNRKADWNQWKARCQDGSTFSPQAWYLPTSQVLILDYTGHPETTAILASAKFAADGAPMPPMPTYLTGHLKSATATSVTIQPFTTYGNDATGKAYAAAHHLSYPFADDYYDAESGPVQKVTIDDKTACTGNIELTGQGLDVTVGCDRFMGARVGLPVGFWLRAGTSHAESVFEIYRP